MKLKLKKVRLAFPELWEAKQVNGEGDPAFSCAFLLPRDHPQIAEINAAIEYVAKEKWNAKAPEVLKQMRATDKTALHDGDLKPSYAGYPDNWFINARNKVQPSVRDADTTPIHAASVGRPYAGCYVNAVVELWAQDNKFGKRINASLSGVQFHSDGDAFTGGRPATDDDFEPITEGAGADDLT